MKSLIKWGKREKPNGKKPSLKREMKKYTRDFSYKCVRNKTLREEKVPHI